MPIVQIFVGVSDDNSPWTHITEKEPRWKDGETSDDFLTRTGFDKDAFLEIKESLSQIEVLVYRSLNNIYCTDTFVPPPAPNSPLYVAILDFGNHADIIYIPDVPRLLEFLRYIQPIVSMFNEEVKMSDYMALGITDNNEDIAAIERGSHGRLLNRDDTIHVIERRQRKRRELAKEQIKAKSAAAMSNEATHPNEKEEFRYIEPLNTEGISINATLHGIAHSESTELLERPTPENPAE